jgi:hypothetical protein
MIRASSGDVLSVNRPRHRVSVLLLAAFQIAAAASVPVVDAMLEIGAASEPLHVESERATSCGDGHDHVFCQLCRTLTVARAVRDCVDHVSHPYARTLVPEARLEGGPRLSYLDTSGPVGPRPPPLA